MNKTILLVILALVSSSAYATDDLAPIDTKLAATWQAAVERLPGTEKKAKRNLDQIADNIAAQIAIAAKASPSSVTWKTSQVTTMALYGKALAQVERLRTTHERQGFPLKALLAPALYTYLVIMATKATGPYTDSALHTIGVLALTGFSLLTFNLFHKQLKFTSEKYDVYSWRLYQRYFNTERKLLQRFHSRIEKTLRIYDVPSIYSKNPLRSNVDVLGAELSRVIGVNTLTREDACVAYLTNELG